MQSFWVGLVVVAPKAACGTASSRKPSDLFFKGFYAIHAHGKNEFAHCANDAAKTEKPSECPADRYGKSCFCEVFHILRILLTDSNYQYQVKQQVCPMRRIPQREEQEQRSHRQT